MKRRIATEVAKEGKWHEAPAGAASHESFESTRGVNDVRDLYVTQRWAELDSQGGVDARRPNSKTCSAEVMAASRLLSEAMGGQVIRQAVLSGSNGWFDLVGGHRCCACNFYMKL